eukprot:scaffold654140_cov59-Prasinocladus_malaysianus.AAC.1
MYVGISSGQRQRVCLKSVGGKVWDHLAVCRVGDELGHEGDAAHVDDGSCALGYERELRQGALQPHSHVDGRLLHEDAHDPHQRAC